MPGKGNLPKREDQAASGGQCGDVGSAGRGKAGRKRGCDPAAAECADPPGSGKCGSGTRYFCGGKPETESESAGSFPDIDGAAAHSGSDLFQQGRPEHGAGACASGRDIPWQRMRGTHTLGGKKEGIEEIQSLLNGKTTVVAGPSGVGKSSLTNLLQPHVQMEVGEVSRKIERGRHTTRHTELICLRKDTYFLDTPGFSSLYLQGIAYEELWRYFPEFVRYEPYCRFQGCLHLSEPDCAVKEALDKGEISRSRYENYTLLAEELRHARKY